MTAKDVVAFWRESAKEDLTVAGELFQMKRFHYCLFFCHLAIEKLLKGLVYKKTNDPPPKIHKLITLAEKADLSISRQWEEDLAEMTTWNIQARYMEYKSEFYKRANKEYTDIWLKKAQEVYQWLSSHY